MRTAGRWLLIGWLRWCCWGWTGGCRSSSGAASGSLLVLGLGALVRQQLAPSRYNRTALPERYRVADDLRQPLAAVVAVAEQDAMTGRR